MGVIEKIKGWFSKKSPPLDIPSSGVGNLVGLYVPKYDDIKKISNKVNEIQDVIDNLPPPTPTPDLSEYAKKNENNSFVPQSIVGGTPWMNFKFTNGKIAGSIQGYNDKFEVKGNYENLVLKSPKNVVLEPTQNAIYEKAPTENNHIANKEYVDSEIAKIPPVDLSDYYNKSEVDNKDTTTLNDAKNYTDSEIAKIPTGGGGIKLYSWSGRKNASITKRDYFRGFQYWIPTGTTIQVSVPTELRNKKLLIAYSNFYIVNPSVPNTQYQNKTINSNVWNYSTITTSSVATIDLTQEIVDLKDIWVGNVGSFAAELEYRIYVIGEIL